MYDLRHIARTPALPTAQTRVQNVLGDIGVPASVLDQSAGSRNLGR